ncbi:Txe/YoeB family addiction module toxin [Vulcanococcus limneticus]|uniref:Txe/YoeB family addiction module toxin n=1 Tax=Vulcanococcus limneticus TaxID=2170428 RepID=UPI0028F4406F|nr:Txe/YoeB family addiction module toxin [Vulcanococcus limneticus]
MPSIERLAWTTAAWEVYLHWQSQDRNQLRRINQLIHACLRDPFAGIGKPEPLPENLAGCWSRRIDEAIAWFTGWMVSFLSYWPAGFTTGKTARRGASRSPTQPSWQRLNWLDG